MKFFVRNEWEQKVLIELYEAPRLLLPLNEVVICYDSEEKKYENIVDGDEYHNIFDIIKTDFNITDVDSLTRVHVLAVLSEMKLEYVEKDDSIIVGDGTETYHVNKFLDTFDINFYIKRNFVLGNYESKHMNIYYSKLFNPIDKFLEKVNYKYNFETFQFEETSEKASHLKDIINNFNVRNLKDLPFATSYIRTYVESSENENDVYLDFGIDASSLYRIDNYPIITKSSEYYYSDDNIKNIDKIYNSIGFRLLPPHPKSCGLIIDGVIHTYDKSTKLLYNTKTRDELEINIEDYREHILELLHNHSTYSFNYVNGKYTNTYEFNAIGKRKGLEHYNVDYQAYSEYECLKLRKDELYVKDEVAYFKVYKNVYLNPVDNTLLKSEEEFEKMDMLNYTGYVISLDKNKILLMNNGLELMIGEIYLEGSNYELYVPLFNVDLYNNIDDYLYYSNKYTLVEPNRILNSIINKINRIDNYTLQYNTLEHDVISEGAYKLLEKLGILKLENKTYSLEYTISIFNLTKSIRIELYQTDNVTNRILKVCHI